MHIGQSCGDGTSLCKVKSAAIGLMNGRVRKGTVAHSIDKAFCDITRLP